MKKYIEIVVAIFFIVYSYYLTKDSKEYKEYKMLKRKINKMSKYIDKKQKEFKFNDRGK